MAAPFAHSGGARYSVSLGLSSGSVPTTPGAPSGHSKASSRSPWAVSTGLLWYVRGVGLGVWAAAVAAARIAAAKAAFTRAGMITIASIKRPC